MFFNAPIWVNELFVNIIEIGINLLYFVVFINVLYFAYSYISFLRHKRKNNEKSINFIKRKNNRVMFISTILACAIIVVFNSPQRLLPNNYELLSVTINAETVGMPFHKIIENKEKLVELRELLNQYKCIKNLDDSDIYRGGGYEGMDMVTIVTSVAGGKGSFNPLQFVITEGFAVRYTSVNTDFVYKIDDKNNTLKSNIIKYINALSEEQVEIK